MSVLRHILTEINWIPENLKLNRYYMQSISVTKTWMKSDLYASCSRYLQHFLSTTENPWKEHRCIRMYVYVFIARRFLQSISISQSSSDSGFRSRTWHSRCPESARQSQPTRRLTAKRTTQLSRKLTYAAQSAVFCGGHMIKMVSLKRTTK